jgi:hypothetical protein
MRSIVGPVRGAAAERNRNKFSRLALGVAALIAAAGCSSPRTTTAGPGYAPPYAQGATFGTAVLHLPGREAPEPVTYRVVNGVAMMGGDIKLGPVDTLQARYGANRMGGAAAKYDNVFSATAIKEDSHLWPGGVIPYVIDPSVPADEVQEIAKAIAIVNETELEVRPRLPTDADYVVFQNQGGVCNSYMGRIGGMQVIEIGPLCDVGGVAHEILHAAGFEHEQARADRDAWITIVWDEILPDFHHAFEKRSGRDLGAYDYASLMHYGPTAFSKSGRQTIIPRVPNVQIGQREGLSQGDKAAISILYGQGGKAPPFGFPMPGGLPIPAGLPIPSSIPIPGGGTLPAGLPPIPDIFGVPNGSGQQGAGTPCAPQDIWSSACNPLGTK